MNYFAHQTAAQRYANGRPYFQADFFQELANSGSLNPPYSKALDVACGTGNSTLALAGIAESVVGVDVSPEMLALAPAHPGIRYVEATAEAIPLPDAQFDLITVCMGFHWFAQETFLREVYRLLVPNGRLLVYNQGFTGQMMENPAFGDWSTQDYPARYPTPPRNLSPISDDQMASLGLVVTDSQEAIEWRTRWTPEELVAYLITQSNVIAQVEKGDEPLEDVSEWLLSSVRPFFPDGTATFLFRHSYRLLQKA